MGMLLNESEVPSSRFLHYYAFYENIVLAFTLFMVPCTVAVMILSSSNVINRYRIYLINELCWSLSFDIMVSLSGAVIIFPLPCFYSVNVLRVLSHDQQILYYLVGVTMAVFKICAVFFQMEHLLVRSLPADSRAREYVAMHVFIDLSNSKKTSLVRHIVFKIVMAVMILTPLILCLPNQEEQRTIVSSLDPFVAQIFLTYPHTVCFATGTNPKKAIFLAFIAAIVSPFIGVIFLVIMYQTMHQNNWSAKTYRLQMMLLRSMVFQLVALVLFISIPAVFLLATPLFDFHNGPIVGVISFCFLIGHTPVDCFMILYFIKPYRQFVYNVMRTLRNYGSSTVSFSTSRLIPSQAQVVKKHEIKMYPSAILDRSTS